MLDQKKLMYQLFFQFYINIQDEETVDKLIRTPNALIQLFFTFMDLAYNRINNNFDKIYQVEKVEFQTQKNFLSVYLLRVLIPIFSNLKKMLQNRREPYLLVHLISDYSIIENKFKYFQEKYQMIEARHLIEDLKDYAEFDMSLLQSSFAWKIPKIEKKKIKFRDYENDMDNNHKAQ